MTAYNTIIEWLNNQDIEGLKDYHSTQWTHPIDRDSALRDRYWDYLTESYPEAMDSAEISRLIFCTVWGSSWVNIGNWCDNLVEWAIESGELENFIEADEIDHEDLEAAAQFVDRRKSDIKTIAGFESIDLGDYGPYNGVTKHDKVYLYDHYSRTMSMDYGVGYVRGFASVGLYCFVSFEHTGLEKFDNKPTTIMLCSIRGKFATSSQQYSLVKES